MICRIGSHSILGERQEFNGKTKLFHGKYTFQMLFLCRIKA